MTKKSDWAAGDLAVCVDDGICPCCGQKFFDQRTVYHVVAVLIDRGAWLEFAGISHNGRKGPWAFWEACSFRKIRPDEHIPCETKFITRLKRVKVDA